MYFGLYRSFIVKDKKESYLVSKTLVNTALDEEPDDVTAVKCSGNVKCRVACLQI